MAVIKKITVIDESIYGDGTSDPFRLLKKSNWNNKSDEDTTENGLTFGGEFANSVDNSMITSITIGDVTTDTEPLFYSFSTPVRIVGDASKIKNDGHWDTILSENITTGVPYVDHAFSMNIPYSEKEAASITVTSHADIGNIDLFYNYYQRQYESAIAGSQFQETILPNLYAFATAMNPDIETNPVFADLITLNGSLSESFIYALNDSGEKTSFYEHGGYLYRYAVDGPRKIFSKQEIATSLALKFTHMFVPYEQVDYLSEAEIYKSYFPMYADITLQTDVNTTFADMLQNSGIGCSYMKDMFESLFDLSTTMTVNEGSFVTHKQFPIIDSDDEGNIFYKQSESIITNTRRSIGVADWWENTYGASTTPIGTAGVFIGELSNETKMAVSDEFSFYKNLIYIIMAGLLRSTLASEIRTFDEIMAGELAYSETLMYRIAKFSGMLDEDTDATPIQNFWLPNSKDIDVIDFIDTQVKFNSEYTYVIYAYQCVLGVEYEYSDIAITRTVSERPQLCVELVDSATGEMVESRFEGSEGNPLAVNPAYAGVYKVEQGNKYIAEFDVTYKPSLQMIEIPIFSHAGKMIDNPPLSPEVDVVPYIGISNKLRFFLSGRLGEEKHDEVIFDEYDTAVYSDIRTSKGLSALEQITFSSDDYPYQYEIYKTAIRPKSYEDFKDSLLTRIEAVIFEDFETRYATVADFEDSIVPNKIYYYIFRSVDIHGKSSNPSPVYQIEMVDDGASVYPVVKTIKFTEANIKTPIKQGRKFLHILPNLRHREINEEESRFEDVESAKDLRGKIIIGSADDPVWNNKFKIRLTSKKTGRKIDLNLEFTTTHMKSSL